jgi:hypothetical protein
MPDKKVPRILFVDDNPEAQSARQRELERYARVKLLHPDEVESRDLLSANLVLVDYQIEEWSQRDEVSTLCMKPQNGLALAAVLRAHLEQSEKTRPVAFAIYSAFLERLSGGPREWSIARANNLEWAFAKNQSRNGASLVDQMTSLAQAVVQLPKEWPSDDAEKSWNLAKKLLSLPVKTNWERRALESIQECHPPIYRLSHSSHGLAFLRWFLQRILPYPCFLMDVHHLSCRLRVTLESLENALKHNKKLQRLLESFVYKGILHDFLGKRWWRSGIESFLWELTEGNSTDAGRIHGKLQGVTGDEIEQLKIGEPVVTLDEDFRPLTKFHEIKESVRIQPEDWPLFADQAWTTVRLANEFPSLRAIVLAQDEARLETVV